MPIRLLSFERHEIGLEIKLLERGAIISFLEPKLRRLLNAKYPTWDLSTVPTEENVFAIKGLVRQATHYAILSHTWLRSDPGEITYSDWISRSFNPDEAGYRKLANFCRVASTNHNLSIGWMDTVCINKDSSSELDESIRSMYNWYQCAKVCIIYLAETTALLDIHRDPWFTRGWTLQELIAPFVVKFYNRNWIQFIQRTNNDKPSPSFSNIIPEILQEIEKATTMSEFELVNISKAPISRSMQLAANRIVTRQEDAAYSLMGIFNVSIATAYGEGSERAFSRLLQEILNVERFGVLDIINWAGLGRSQRSHILPRSPQQYRFCSSSLDLSDVTPLEPLTLTNMGTRIFVLLMPGISIARPTGRDQHPKVSPNGDYTATVNITDPDDDRLGKRTFHLLDRRISGPDGGKESDNGQLMTQNTFAVFNIEWKPGGLYIPQTCVAVVLRCFEDAGKVTSTGMFLRVYTSEPCVFKLKKRSTERRSRNTDSYVDMDEAGEVIAVEDLRKHGMQLVLKYL
ncbi:hypothetical protein BDN70DRAFT_880035 [Pholiota conissans]|uniref:Heterokaryon incompatibility domain-containing protein n=1 Tax=Pholiota conissans TaxID=109636 RepID=A0A9P5Z0A5_9AGAR|nr:hypothetical protein BDN70DRAFT_880035 [Pholiota conissans]